jgi:anti-sigma regulatory factor (Ser/Thr protein kinase)
MQTTFTLQADKLIQSAFRQHARAILDGLDVRQKDKILIAINEVLQNIVRHAYKFEDSKFVEITINMEDHLLSLEIRDHAPPCHPELFLHRDHVPNEEGKMGLRIIMNCTHFFDIKPLAAGNLTSMQFKI